MSLDVFHAEPIKPYHPLARLDNVTVTPRRLPHSGGLREPAAPRARHRAQGAGLSGSMTSLARRTPVQRESC
jgi:phosphoglycerate dehydrogenase-like enzyme